MNNRDKERENFQEFQKILNNKGLIGIFGEIDDELSMGVVAALTKLDRGRNNTIIMLINSPGGYIPDAIAIIDVMKGIRSKIHTVIVGEACSMAGVISVCGDKRSITEHSYWMAHPTTDYIEDYIKFIKDRTRYLDMLETKLENIFKKKTKLIKKDYEKMRNGELWLDAWQCIDKGICDNLITKYIYPIRRRK